MTRDRWLATSLWVASFLFVLATLAFLNDHFGRISPARQIVAHGELPFRDFFDPGYFLTELTSAALLWLLGDNLLGEALLTTASVATGTVLVFLLARQLTGSILVALAVSVAALLSAPRAYDYDKVLFYPLGILLCWRYAARPVPARLWAFAAGLVAGALFRYDTGAYLVAAGLVVIAVVHAGNRRIALRRGAMLFAAIALLSLPAALFVQANGGISDALDQMLTYGRRETARTTLRTQTFSRAPLVGLASPRGEPSKTQSTVASRAGALFSVRVLPGWWTASNANALVYFYLRLLPLAGVLILLLHGARRDPDVTRFQAAQVLSLATMCLLLNVFILRDPISARVGGMAGPTAILSGWLFHRAWQVRKPAARASVAALSALIVWGVLATADWHDQLSLESFRPSRMAGMLRMYAASPRDAVLMPSTRMTQMVQYLRECTGPADRILLAWFAPEVYFFAQRGFAAGMVAVFGEHWSEPRFQEQSVRLLAAQSVPIVILRAGDDRFDESYPLIVRYLRGHYRDAGTSTFGDDDAPEGYTVLVRNDRIPAYTHPITSLPCFW